MSEFLNLVGVIKRARAVSLLHGPASDVVMVHRKFEGDHTADSLCWCVPMIITQSDWRPSAYFAEQALNPIIH